MLPWLGVLLVGGASASLGRWLGLRGHLRTVRLVDSPPPSWWAVEGVLVPGPSNVADLQTWAESQFHRPTVLVDEGRHFLVVGVGRGLLGGTTTYSGASFAQARRATIADLALVRETTPEDEAVRPTTNARGIGHHRIPSAFARTR